MRGRPGNPDIDPSELRPEIGRWFPRVDPELVVHDVIATGFTQCLLCSIFFLSTQLLASPNRHLLVTCQSRDPVRVDVCGVGEAFALSDRRCYARTRRVVDLTTQKRRPGSGHCSNNSISSTTANAWLKTSNMLHYRTDLPHPEPKCQNPNPNPNPYPNPNPKP